MHMPKYLLFFFSFVLLQSVNAQIQFEEKNDLIDFNETFSGAPMAIQDINGDRFDDILVLDGTKDVSVYFQNPGQKFTKVDYGTLSGFAWGMTAGDLNNDGWSDVFAGGAYDDIKVSMLIDDQGSMMNSILDGPSIFVQAVSYADINNDGFLDAYACHDDGPSSIYINDGTGTLSFDTDVFDTSKFGSTETNAGNYGCVWSDIDGDNDLDLYVAKCRQGVNQPMDPRRINQLWLNDGNNNYSEHADSFGLAIGWQSWTAEFQDIDNDGDFDAFITNHDHESQLLENVNNTFVDITANSGIIVNGLPIQGVMKDFDNDGFVDIFVTGADGQMFLNNGDKTFTEISPLERVNSFAIGDLNSDGFLDIFAGYGSGFNNPGAGADIIHMNQGNDNNYLSVALQGVVSNRDAIGAKLTLHGPWGIQVREVRAGESYGITHSAHQNFGLGTNTNIDSLVINWPSGIREVYQDIEINQSIGIIEGLCITPTSAVIADGPLIFCEGEDVTLTAASGYTYLWSTGETSQSITVATDGVYLVTVYDGSDCFASSAPFIVEVDPEESFSISTDFEIPFCEGEEIVIDADFNGVVNWSNGLLGTSITVNAAGTYSATATGVCETIESNVIEVTTLDSPDIPTVADVTIDLNTSTELMASGTDPRWYDEEFGGEPIATGNNFTTPLLNVNTTYYVEDYNEYVKPPVSVGEPMHTGTNDYNGDNFNAFTLFTVFDKSTLETIDVETDFAGIRKIILMDADFTVLNELSVDLMPGLSTIELNWELDPNIGSYQLGTEDVTNQATFGINSPRLKRTSTDFEGQVNFPYVIDNIISIDNTTFGDAFYYYFYNWKIGGLSDVCVSDRTPVTVTVSTSSNLNIDEVDFLKIYPNPSSDFVTIEIKENRQFDLILKSLDGKVIYNFNAVKENYQLDMNALSNGMYLLELRGDEDVIIARIVKQ